MQIVRLNAGRFLKWLESSKPKRIETKIRMIAKRRKNSNLVKCNGHLKCDKFMNPILRIYRNRNEYNKQIQK